MTTFPNHKMHSTQIIDELQVKVEMEYDDDDDVNSYFEDIKPDIGELIVMQEGEDIKEEKKTKCLVKKEYSIKTDNDEQHSKLENVGIEIELQEQIMQQHENIQSADEQKKCNLCGKEFQNLLHLKNHNKFTHSECRNHKCTICDIAFKKKSYLNCHLTIHTNNNPFQCEMCHKKFRRKWCLDRHKLCHIDDKNYKCTICNETYKSMAYLNSHIKRVHIETRNFKCEKCGAAFKTNTDLNYHGRVHTETRPYRCDMCQKAYKCPSSLTKHFLTRTHTRHVNGI